MSAWTPGPWTVAPHSSTTVMGGDRSIASTGGYVDGRLPDNGHAENVANARLIAAAPEMHAFINRLATWEPLNPPQSQRAGGYDEAMDSVATLARALLRRIEGDPDADR